MLKDESEDEEDQVNFELDLHLTTPINMDTCHKYRTEIRDQVAQTTHLNTFDREKLIEEYRDADFWLTKGISTTTHNQLSTAI